jgi:anaerobic selenocysteine-containing dehydrogenase
VREVARLYATSRASMILWGMGISQHVHGTDNARCLIALALMTGQIGRPGTGLHPLRGQNNVQGASDAGLIPMMYPDYQRVTTAAARSASPQAWGVPCALDAARPDGGGGDARHQRRPGQGHVHHGREPGDERPRRASTRARRWPRWTCWSCRTSS